MDICAARNNNVQLLVDTKANQAGHYETIKQALDPVLAQEVIWKTNEPGRIPVRDIVALSWIPLSVLKLPEDVNCTENPQKYLRSQPTSTFYNQPMDFQYPDGFIMPLVYALSTLMIERNGKLEWKDDPYRFLQRNLPSIVQQYKGILDLSQWDPQKVGKNSVSYSMAKQQFEHCLLMQEHKAA